MQLFYREKGIDTHPPLIILHGLWGASDNWLPVADLLSHRFHVILPDLRNHGCSPHSSLFDYTILSQDTEELIGRLNLPQRPFLAGHSLGGKTIDAFSIETSGNRRKSGNHRYLPANLYFRQADYAPKPVGIYPDYPASKFPPTSGNTSSGPGIFFYRRGSSDFAKKYPKNSSGIRMEG
ncbi:alpha/beta fold hydrolase [Odoribacter splanchnicus]|nr:alpha/beta fold hydrolase [Odoribacter splanchnicus]